MDMLFFEGLFVVEKVKDIVELKVVELNNFIQDFEIYIDKVINIVIVVKELVVGVLGVGVVFEGLFMVEKVK